MLQTVENRIAMPPEMAIEAENHRFIQLLNRTVMDEYLEQRNREIDLTVQQAMLSGHLTSYYTPDRIVTPGRVMQNNHMKSAWFEHAAHLELKNPSILNFSSAGRPTRTPTRTPRRRWRRMRKRLPPSYSGWDNRHTCGPRRKS